MLKRRPFLFIAMNLKSMLRRGCALAAAALLTLTLAGCSRLLSLLPLDQFLPPDDTENVSHLPEGEPITLETLPPWSGEPYVELEYNIPAFTEEERTALSFESYSPLDLLQRCGPAFALVGPETMPTEERGPIGQVKPSGWHTVRYDDLVEGKYLYNRCHLIGYQLTGENANEENLITGTRYLNVTGMLPFENAVADYVQETGNHVLYRVTPIFKELDLVARGVVMEAQSMEDDALAFHVFVYNVQPGITIDYLTGESRRTEDADEENLPPPPPVPEKENPDEAPPPSPDEETQPPETAGGENTDITYVLNKKSLKFHIPTCEGAQSMSEKNKELFSGTREEAIAAGYAPCGTCKP